jgi:hypothetical protein
MTQSHYVASPAALSQYRFDSMLDAAVAEIAQERISRAQGQERQGRSITRPITAQRLRIQAVHHFVGSAIAADGNKIPHAARVRIAGDLCGFSGSAGCRHLDFYASGSQTLEGRAQQFAASSAACRGIHDCEISLPQVLDPFRKMNSRP